MIYNSIRHRPCRLFFQPLLCTCPLRVYVCAASSLSSFIALLQLHNIFSFFAFVVLCVSCCSIQISSTSSPSFPEIWLLSMRPLLPPWRLPLKPVLPLSTSQLTLCVSSTQGGFAKCYEIVDDDSKKVYAGKIVSKKLMVKHNQKEKMTQEIQIHRSLNHKNIVKFFSFFDDPQNVYIVLELCKNRVS